MSEQPSQTRKRTRSPAYPAIDLSEAIQKASVLWTKATRHWIGINNAVKFWGYEPSSSSGHSALSALKKFGLLEERGDNAGREVKLTDAGIKLVFNPDLSSDEYLAALKSAALAPAIHAEIWSKFDGELPDDAIIERYLVIEKLFNAIYAKPFINQFRSTISFARLNADDTIHGNLDEPPATMPQAQLQRTVPKTIQNPPAPEAPVSILYDLPKQQVDSRREIRLPHPAGDITIRGPFPMSSADWTTFTALMTAFRTWLVKDEPQSSTASSSASPQPPEQSASDDLESY